MKRRWIVAGAMCGTALIVSGVIAAGLRVNVTDSMPRGIWWKLGFSGALHRGDTVTICLPADALIKRYVGPGSCPNGMEPVVKMVAALPGDLVAFDRLGVLVNGLRLENTAPLTEDTQGRPLAAWGSFGGSYWVEHNEMFLLSSFDPRSFDSRYLGPIPVSMVIARNVPVLTW